MLNLENRHAFGPTGDLLGRYNGPRPCASNQGLLHMLQQAVRAERAALFSGMAVAATEDTPNEVDGVLARFETHLTCCPNCSGYRFDPSLVD